MKKILLIIAVALFVSSGTNAQFLSNLQTSAYQESLPTSFLQTMEPRGEKSINFGKNEYLYLSARAGFVHGVSFLSTKEFQYKFLHTPIGEMPLSPSSSVDYTAGYYGDILFNYDFDTNEDIGIVVGVGAQDYGISAKYMTSNEKYWYKEEYRATTVTVPVYFKYGKDHFEDMRYAYGGFKVIQNMAGRHLQQVSWAEANIKTVELDKGKNLTVRNYAATLGFNYIFYHFEANYVVGSFLSEGSVVPLYNQNLEVQPYSVFPQGILYFKTGLNIPLSRWTMRKSYDINKKLRGIFK